jgi:hypothetical protein
MGFSGGFANRAGGEMPRREMPRREMPRREHFQKHPLSCPAKRATIK